MTKEQQPGGNEEKALVKEKKRFQSYQ